MAPKVNHRLARYQLQQFKQKNDESVDDFLTRCRNQASKCRFRDKIESDERLIEQLIVGTKHKKIQERLLEKGEQLTLDEAIDIARMYEATTSQLEQLESEKKDIKAIKGNVNKHCSDKKPMKMKCNNCGLELPLRLYRRMYPEYLTPDGFPKPEAVQQSPTVLTAYGGAKIKQHGKCTISCEFNRKR